MALFNAVETIGRKALLSLSESYAQIADAVFELIDNPVDHSHGRLLNIDVNFSKDDKTLTVYDHGGRGMGEEELIDYLAWGDGAEHSEDDIGEWGVGGKSAAIYLGEGLDIRCRKSGETEIFHLQDPHWGSRTGLIENPVKKISGVDAAKAVSNFNALGPREGFTEVTISGLREGRRDISKLKQMASETYRQLIHTNRVVIRIDGELLKPMDIPVSTSIPVVGIPSTNLGGIRVKGSVWATERDAVGHRMGMRWRAGIRTNYNGRRITYGEQFGHNLAGKGNLQRLTGEIQISHIKPNTQKTDWDRDSLEWQKLEKFMHEKMSPVVAALRNLSTVKPISRTQRKRAQRVKRAVEETFSRLAKEALSPTKGTLSGQTNAPGGRKSPTPKPGPKTPNSKKRRKKQPTKNPTAPPKNPVGSLVRRLNGSVPDIELDALGHTERSHWGSRDDGAKTVVINTDFPVYKGVGETDEYMMDTFVRHILQEDALNSGELRHETDRIIWTALKAGTP